MDAELAGVRTREWRAEEAEEARRARFRFFDRAAALSAAEAAEERAREAGVAWGAEASAEVGPGEAHNLGESDEAHNLGESDDSASGEPRYGEFFEPADPEAARHPGEPRPRGRRPYLDPATNARSVPPPLPSY